MVHNVSPGCTTCGTAATADGAERLAAEAATMRVTIVRRTRTPPRGRVRAPRCSRIAAPREPVTRAYGNLQGDMQPADLRLWAQKWRWYERNTLPWNRARIHFELARRKSFARWPIHGNVLELLLDGRLE